MIRKGIKTTIKTKLICVRPQANVFEWIKGANGVINSFRLRKRYVERIYFSCFRRVRKRVAPIECVSVLWVTGEENRRRRKRQIIRKITVDESSPDPNRTWHLHCWRNVLLIYGKKVKKHFSFFEVEIASGELPTTTVCEREHYPWDS